jgi:uncharacterized protein YbbC (DUF1343 family)
MKVRTGLDILRDDGFKALYGRKIGVLCHQASVDGQYQHILDLLLPLYKKNKFRITSLFGPQHGLWGHTQDNMIEWEGYQDPRLGLKIYSLYGEHRKPSAEMLKDIDLMLIDLQDVGARYYTFIWTMALIMQACTEAGIEVMVLDRPNPISGLNSEGTILKPGYQSFVGLYPLPQRHAFTIAEIASYFKGEFLSGIDLKVIRMSGWQRKMHFPDTRLPWVMPSPNMPGWETALVYPGMCLFEGTNISEGRGTTRPFEIFGAPWLDGWKISEKLNGLKLPGVYFRPLQFQPTFHKFAGEICQGAFIHLTDREVFKPVLTALAILRQIHLDYLNNFQWKQPPYEYEYEKLPIDILSGTDRIRQMIDNSAQLKEIQEFIEADCAGFDSIRSKYLLY